MSKTHVKSRAGTGLGGIMYSSSMAFQPQFRRFSFAGFSVDVTKREIRHQDGDIRRLVGKPFDILVYLGTHHDRFVSTEELLEQFWSNKPVKDVDVPHACYRPT